MGKTGKTGMEDGTNGLGGSGDVPHLHRAKISTGRKGGETEVPNSDQRSQAGMRGKRGPTRDLLWVPA
eukprot:8609684-Prorocentrum_lima.AAC.1